MVLKPAREHATNNAQTYFVAPDTWERREPSKADFLIRSRRNLDQTWRYGVAALQTTGFATKDCDKRLHYIHLNRIKKHLYASPPEYRYSSAYPGWNLDLVPQGLKPSEFIGPSGGTAEAVPFQN